jgi:D-sedoheptulose 7-phosphate isomerase
MDGSVSRSQRRGFVGTEIAKLRDALDLLAEPAYVDLLVDISEVVEACLRSNGRVFFCGNGGSAADSQHLAAELVGRQNFDRPPAAGIALTVDTSALTALGNDYGFESVFSRQIQALGRPGDVLIGLSTSGRSQNVVEAVSAAQSLGMRTVAMTGIEPRALASAEFVLAVPASETAKIQELHITSGHVIFALVEHAIFGRD